MAKRQQLTYDEQNLTEQLKASSGQGMDVFFPSQGAPDSENNDHQNDSQSDLHPDSPNSTAEGEPLGDQTYVRTDEQLVDKQDLYPADRLETDLWSLPPIPNRRKSERYAFQFWADQITRLKKLNQLLNLLADLNDRSAITLSDMAREAFDVYLEQQTIKFEEMHPREPYGRTGVRTNQRTNGHVSGRRDAPNES